MTELANIVLLRAHAGRSDPLGKALQELIVLTRKEPGCVICELHQSSDDLNSWMVYERWRDRDAFACHMEQAYVERFLAQLGDLVSEPAEVRAFLHRR